MIESIRYPEIIAIRNALVTDKWESELVKGYLRFKTITFQNVSAKAQIKNLFIS